MKKTTTLTILLLFVGTIIFSSCSNKIHQIYTGPKRLSNEIAVLKSFDPVRLLKIDNKFGPGNIHFGYSSRWNSKCVVELEPGNHKIVVKTVKNSSNRMYLSGDYLVSESEYSISKPKELSFLFEAGKVYQITEMAGNFHFIEVK